MKRIRGMIASMITFFVRDLFNREPGPIELEREGSPPKGYRHLFTIMDRGRDLF